MTKTGRQAPGSAFGIFAEPRVTIALLAAWFVILAIFYLMPSIDVWFSGIFFAEAPCPPGTEAGKICGAFWLTQSQFLQRLRSLLQLVPVIVAIGLLVRVAVSLRQGALDADGRHYRVPLAALATLVLGPGLIVNGILKAYSGRPRPRAVDLFGGDLPFIPAGQVTDYCASNCSFVSGEGSSAFWLLCLLPLVPATYRREVIPAVCVLVAFMATLRVAFGAHFLSDVLLGGLSTLVVFSALAVVIGRVWPTPPSSRFRER